MELSSFDNKHLNQRGFVIGGGPSILDIQKNFDFKLLENEITVGSNKAYKLFNPTYLFCLDRYYVKHFISELNELNCTLFIPNSYHTLRNKNCYGLSKQRGKHKPLTKLPSSFQSEINFGNNSGVASLIIAYLLGLNPIYLVGIDIVHTDPEGRTHFHSEYNKTRIVKTTPARYDLFYNDFKTIIQFLTDKGVTVYSCSPCSRLNEDISFIVINTLFKGEK